MKIKDFSDERGFSFALEGLPLEHFHILSLNPGRIRGNHVHDYGEVICILGGEGKAKVCLEHKGQKKEFIIEKKFEILEIPPGTRHSIQNIGQNLFYLVCFRSPS